MNPTPPDMLTAALTLHAAGCSVVSVRADGTKHPRGAWKIFQTDRATEQQIRRWFADGHPGVGIVTGAVSGGLEMLELEGRAITEGVLTQLAEIIDASGMADLWTRISTGWLERSPSGGLHFHYRVTGAPVPGNTKLASRLATDDELTDDERALQEKHPNKKILRGWIETRGEGGFVVTAPSHGSVHPSGKPYELLAGGPATCPVITTDEHRALHAVCRMIDTVPSDDVAKVEPAADSDDIDADQRAFLFSSGPDTAPGGTSPGDDFEQRTTWPEILTAHGWTLLRTIGATSYWRRPGKTDPGPSATTGRAADRDRLYVFTTSTEFDAERPYTKFGAYALLNHGGNHSAAAKELRRLGYGQPAPEPVRHLTAVPNSVPTPVDGANALNVVPHPTAAAGKDAGPSTYTRTDDGNALRLVDQHETEIRYVPQRGKWLVWDGHRWAWDDAGSVREMARAIARALPGGEGEVKHRMRSLSSGGLAAMVTVAQTDPRIVVPVDRLDAWPLHLNTPGGVVDLATGTITPADPNEMHTRSTTVAPDPEAKTPRWNQFLTDTFGDDTEIAAFVQRLAGYSASGDTRFHVLPFLNGPGGNGKTVFLDVLRFLLGDYAASTPSSFLMAGQQQHETEIARLHGLRLVVASEVNQDARFDEAKMKLLTGGDALTARFMRQDHFTFEPTHHLWLMGNHLPAVKAGGDSFWRRLRLIPFTRTVPEERKIDGLARILADEEGPGILTWVIAGAADAFKDGLRPPASVMAFTETYAQEEDSLARFMADCCIVGGGEQVLLDTKKLRSAYEDWCRGDEDKPLAPQVFGRELRTRFGIEQKRSNGRRFYIGLTLIDRSLPEDDDEPHWSDR